MDQFEAVHGDDRKDRDRRAAEDAFRDRSQQSGEFRHQGGEQNDRARKAKHAAVDDLGRADNADVLAVSRGRLAAYQGADQASCAIGDNAAFEFLVHGFTVVSADRHGREIADRLDGIDHKQH